jgi:hypothetical protein
VPCHGTITVVARETFTALWDRVDGDYADFHVEAADADEAFAFWHAACDHLLREAIDGAVGE